uniref:Mos1 transposase HTH domain-containing protein n=1 Tax=Trichuris muris TaxID=70415 RepID=A0A5S6QNQ6_TRIMR
MGSDTQEQCRLTLKRHSTTVEQAFTKLIAANLGKDEKGGPQSYCLEQGWGTSGPRDHSIRPLIQTEEDAEFSDL